MFSEYYTLKSESFKTIPIQLKNMPKHTARCSQIKENLLKYITFQSAKLLSPGVYQTCNEASCKETLELTYDDIKTALVNGFACEQYKYKFSELTEIIDKQKDSHKGEDRLHCLLDNKTISEEKLIALAEENTNTIKDLRTQITKAQERLAFVEHLHSNQMKIMQNLNEKIEQLTRENEQYKLNHEMAKNQSISPHALNKEVEKANLMIRAEQNKVFDLERTIHELASRLAELEQVSVQNVQLVAENEKLQTKLDQAYYSINMAGTQMRTHQQTIDMLKRDNADLDEKIASIRKLF